MSARPLDTMDAGAGGVATLPERLSSWLSPGRRAVLWSFVDQAVVSGFGFITGITTGRLVGLGEFGRFALVMVFVTLAWGIYQALFTTPMMTLAGYRDRSRAYFGTVVVWGVVGAVLLGVASAMLFTGYYALRGEVLAPDFIAATGFLVAIHCVLLLLRRLLFAQRNGRLAVAMDLGRYLLFVAVIGALLLAHVEVDAGLIVWGLAGSGLVAALAVVPATGVAGARLRSRLTLTMARQHWQIARWLVAVVLVGFGQEQLLVILAGFSLGDELIGGIRAAQYLFGPILVLMSAMENVLPVRAAAAHSSGGLVGLKDFLVRFGTILVAANGVLLLVAVLPGALWLRLLFGPTYADYAIVMPYLGAAAACFLVRDVLLQYFRAIRTTDAIFHSFLAGFICAVALIYPLVEWFGVVGLAIDTLASQFVSMVYMIVAVGRHYWRHRRATDLHGTARA